MYVSIYAYLYICVCILYVNVYIQTIFVSKLWNNVNVIYKYEV